MKANYIDRLKELMLMKLIILFICLLSLSSVANTFSQQITLSVKNEKLVNVIKELRKQSKGYDFALNSTVLDKAKPVTLKFQNLEFKKALDLLFKDQPLRYEIKNKTILIKEKPIPHTSDNTIENNNVFNPLGLDLQQEVIQGRVVDSLGNPMPGVTVRVLGTKKSTMTDHNGSYRLFDVKHGTQVSFSFLGYKTRTVTVSGNVLNIALQFGQDFLDEVVINTGYYSLPLERSTGAVTYLDEKQLSDITAVSLKDKLEGLVPGLLFEPNYNSDQDASTDRSRAIVLRGQNNTAGNTMPLIVVDGFPIITTDGIDPWSTINPNDVKDVTVLKDAAAAAIWGGQSANGVIVITTKRGGATGSSINADIEYIAQPTPNLYDIPFASSTEAVDIYKYMFKETTYFNTLTSATNRSRYDFPAYMDLLVQWKAKEITEEQLDQELQELAKIDVRDEFTDLFLRKERYKKATVSFSSVSSNNNLRASVMTLNNEKFSYGNSGNQIIGNMNNIFSPNKWLSVNFGLNISVANNKLNGVDIRDLQSIPQMSKILDENGDYLPMIKQSGEFYYTVPTSKRRELVEQYNLPYDWDWNLKREIDNTDIKENKKDLRVTGGLTLTPFEGVNLDLLYKYQNNDGLYSNYMNTDTWYVRNAVLNYYRKDTDQFPIPQGGMLYERRDGFISQYGRFQATVNKTWSDHNIRALGGMELRADYRESIPYGYYGYDPVSLTHVTALDHKNTVSGPPLSTGLGTTTPAIPPIPTLRSTSISIRGRDDRFLSYYGNIGYSYKNRYDVTGSVRLDKTNLYGRTATYREHPQWSAGAGYILSNEDFFKVKPLNFLKFRVAYGLNGLIDKSASGYISATAWLDPINQAPYGSIQVTPNPGLTWEKTANLNFGMDFGMFSNRLKGTIEIYKKNTTNVLAEFEVNPTYGFYYDGAVLNQGKMKNKGVEIELSGLVIDSKLKWRSAFNYSHNKNEVVNIKVAGTNMATRTTMSQFYSIPGLPTDYISVAEFAGYDDQGLLQVMYEGKPQNILAVPYIGADLDDLFKYAGQRSPKHYGSWINNFTYGNFELSARLQYSFGHKFLNDSPPRSTLYYMQLSSSYFTFLPQLMVDRWMSPEDNETASMYGLTTRVANYNATIANDILSEYNSRNLLDAGNIRLQSISLAYRLPGSVLGKVFKNARVQVQARNLKPIYLVNKEGIDPLFPKYSGSLYSAYYNTVRSRPEYSISLKFGL
ncbi:SusC/RagA family TonB-linked outer membrane protein [Sphingobacterium faecale]|nr:SusC/RagA family TonB-linked outer membrane protein [Sphingobacterium faecale]